MSPIPPYLRIIPGGLDRTLRSSSGSCRSHERLTISGGSEDCPVKFSNSAITGVARVNAMLPSLLGQLKYCQPGDVHSNLNSQRALELLVQ